MIAPYVNKFIYSYQQVPFPLRKGCSKHEKKALRGRATAILTLQTIPPTV